MFRNYLTVAYRNLVRYKVYSAINITGLAIGIAFCILTFLYIRHEWSFDAFHEKADRIYRIYNKGEIGEGSDASAYMPGPLAPALAEAFSTQMQHVVRIFNTSRTFQYGDHSFQERVIYVDSGFWDVFSFPLIKGDPATALNRKDTIIISETVAQKFFGNTDPMGKSFSFTRNSKIHQALITGIIKDIPETSSIQFGCIQSYENVEDALNSWNYINNISTYVLLHNQVRSEDIEKLLPRFLNWSWPITGENQELKLQPLADVHFNYLRTKPLGFDSEHLIAVSRLSKLRDLGPKGIETYRDALLSHHAILGVTPIYHMMRNGYQSRGAVIHDGTTLKGVEIFFVDYDFVPTLDIKLIEGRNYSRELVTDPTASVIINQTLAKQLGPGPPLGKTLKFFDDMTVIGVVSDFHFRSLHHKIGPAFLKC
ncbi:MAG: ABC transporter permease, partial [Candidatus Poribacteria bacterium]|nr:ABC transporter permease [Candidatus Poribacteria bacterium]